MGSYDCPEIQITPDEPKPDMVCPGCDCDLYEGDRLYKVGGKLVCEECFKNWVCKELENAPATVAEWLGTETGRVERRRRPCIMGA